MAKFELTKEMIQQAQERLNFLNPKLRLEEDGIYGDKTKAAVKWYQSLFDDLRDDGELGPLTWNKMFVQKLPKVLGEQQPKAVKPLPSEANVTLDDLLKYFEPGSATRLLRCVPPLRKLAVEVARAGHVFSILDSLRGKAAQELAFKRKASKAHFGQSAHNYDPPVAYDFVPWKHPSLVDWDQAEKWHPVIATHQRIAKEMGISIRSLGDPNRDGKFDDGWDFPHIELHPWREAVKKYGSDLYMG